MDASNARHDNYESYDRNGLINELRSQKRKRHYHFELLQRYRERMVKIMRDTDELIQWYDGMTRHLSVSPEMKKNIRDFQKVLKQETSCSVCGGIVSSDTRECLIPRCAHLVHTRPVGGRKESCYAILMKTAAERNSSTIPCPVCGEQLPKNVQNVI